MPTFALIFIITIIMEFSAQQIAQILAGEVEGNAEAMVSNFSKIEEGKPGTITFLANPKYASYLYDNQASIVLINRDFVLEKAVPKTLTLVRVPNAYFALAQLLDIVNQVKPRKCGIEQPSFVHPSTTMGEGVYIGAFAYLGENVKLGENVAVYPNSYIGDNVSIGSNTTIYAGVKIYEGCVVGNDCIIHAGAVVGSDGFGFAKEGEEFKKIPQLGNVVIEDNVEIGANTAIDRAVMGSTILHKGVKLDNLVHVAHNVEIGENTGLAAQTGIAGSTKIGKNCVAGGQAGFGGHIKIGDNVSVGAQSGIISNVKDGRRIIGSPAIDVNKFLRSSIIFPKLPEIYTQLGKLEKMGDQKAE